MELQKLAKRLEGIYTVEMLEEELGISRRTAINYLSLLRKGGYVATQRGSMKKRLYTISPVKMRQQGQPGLYETINKYSRIKLLAPYPTLLHGRKLSAEEAIVEAVNAGDYRIIIASIPLFNHVKSWPLLSRLAKERDIGNKVGALYDVARTIIKTKKIDKRTENSLKRQRKKDCLVSGLKIEKDFKEIGRKWNVIVGLSKHDLRRLKE